jgi:hypothetical protein
MLGNTWNRRIVPILQKPTNCKSEGAIRCQDIPKKRFEVELHLNFTKTGSIKNNGFIAVYQYPMLQVATDRNRKHQFFEIAPTLN